MSVSLTDAKISVIIPVYNVRPYLKYSLESVINQTYKNIEVIVIDDGSDDGSEDICDLYAKKDSRIRVIHQRNMGLSAARNTGLENISGDFVAFLDPDDVFYSDALERMLNTILKEDADIVVCGVTVSKINSIIGVLGAAHRNRDNSNRCEVLTLKESMHAAVEERIVGWAWNKLYRRRIWRDIRFPIGRVYEDAFILFDILELSKKVCLMKDHLVIHRLRSKSITRTASLKSLIDDEYTCRHNEQYIAQHIPDYFTVVSLKRYKRHRVNIYLIRYGWYYGSCDPEKKRITRWAKKRLTELAQKEDIRGCGRRTLFAYMLYKYCPIMLKFLVMLRCTFFQ